MPNDNTNTNNSNQTNDVPQVFSEDVLPPMPQENTPVTQTVSTISNDQTKLDTPLVDTKEDSTKELETNTDSGSAAPSGDINLPPVVIGTTPKKKFGSGKVIATILGLFLLVGGIGAGTLLVQQNQDVREKAANSCYDDCRKESGAKVCDCRCNGICTRPDYQTDPQSPDNPVVTPAGNSGDISTGKNQSQCDANLWCTGCGGFCLSGSYTGGGCNAAQQSLCGQTVVYGCSADQQVTFTKVDGSTGIYCKNTSLSSIGSDFGSYVIYLCSPSLYAQYGYCDSRLNGLPGYSTLNNLPNNFCGVIQVDSTTASTHVSFQDNSCSENTTNNNPTPTAPSITASCQNVKAYSSTWTSLTSTQLSQLKTGDSINFCVTGTATGGSFNKAKFTINGVVQAETTTVRPSSTDFCQSYVIPSGVTTFNVSAQINHVTLGWK